MAGTIGQAIYGQISGTATDEPALLWLGFLAGVVVILVWSSAGRFVSVQPSVGFSRPSLRSRARPIFMRREDVKSFRVIHSPRDPEKILALIIETRDGARLKYAEVRTPGMAEAIHSILREWGISESESKRQATA